jgi:hypothetical protein
MVEHPVNLNAPPIAKEVLVRLQQRDWYSPKPINDDAIEERTIEAAAEKAVEAVAEVEPAVDHPAYPLPVYGAPATPDGFNYRPCRMRRDRDDAFVFLGNAEWVR